jgi:CheY-like chemotaxis protein
MKKVLIIEDNLAMKQLLSKIASEIGDIETKTVDDGLKAIDIYKEFKPDLILCDITLPSLNGVEVIKKIRKSDKKVKVIFCSAWINKNVIEETEHLDILGFISKPFHLEEIMSIIIEALKDEK